MRNELKLLTGPKVTLDQIRWPKAADFQHNFKNIVFDMEVVRKDFDVGRGIVCGDINLHNFGPRDIGGVQGLDALRNIGLNVVDHNPPMLRDIQEKWRRNQQFGRLMRDHDKLAIKACDLFNANGREFEGAVMRPDMELVQPLHLHPAIKFKMPKARAAVGAFKLDGVKNIRVLPDIHFGGGGLVYRRKDVFDRAGADAKKPNPLEALKAHWKDAPKPKPGIGYGHPALKGLIHGRNRRAFEPLSVNWCDEPKRRGLWVGGVGGILDECHHNRGLFDAWQDMFKPAQLNTEQREAKRIERLEAEKREAEREAFRRAENKALHYEQQRIKRQFTDSAGSYIRIALMQLKQPGANVCQLLANMWAVIKKHRYSGTDIRDLLIGGLKALGYTILGNGHFSCAMQGPDGFVYKVNANHKDSDGWYAYAVNTMHFGSDLKCVPQIDAIAYRDKTYCVKMERLIPLSRGEFEPFEELNNAFRMGGTPEKVAKLMGVSERDAETLCYIIRTTKDETPGSRLDIHYENVMYRRDKHGHLKLVLTDPLAYGSFEMKFYDKRLTTTGIVPRSDVNLAA